MSAQPNKIGKYRILDVAGRGAMGVVYLGHDPFSDRQVAVKVCTFDENDDDATNRLIRKLFFNEAHTAGALDHPNVLQVYDAGESNEGAAFVYHGGADGIVSGNPATAAAQLEGDHANAFLGASVAGAGDVDGDGYADVIVGGPGYDNGQSDEGVVLMRRGLYISTLLTDGRIAIGFGLPARPLEE